MSYILNIETSGTICSVSLGNEGKVLETIEISGGYTHAENLHPFINQLLQKTEIKPADLSAVALSAGPGSYTGLRIGTSAAKGLCYALKIPLIGISTLLALCEAAKEKHASANYYIPMLDARRMEIYTAVYTNSGEEILQPHARIMDKQTASELVNYNTICLFGDGMLKCLSLIEKTDGVTVLNDITPSAKYLHILAFEKFQKKQFENIAYFEPYYLKEYMFAQKQK